VLNGASLGIQASLFTPQAQATQGPVTFYNAEEYPVFIPLAVLPLTAGGFDSYRVELASGTSQVPLLTLDTGSPLFRNSTDPNSYLASLLDPASLLVKPVSNIVLYRQMVSTQGRDTANTADLVQVSPLIQNVSWLPVIGNRSAIVDQNILAIPYHNGSRYMHAVLALADLHPISDSSEYRYFLVQFDTNGEIAFTIDAGSVTTPSPP
jgi:hypothetical protein